MQGHHSERGPNPHYFNGLREITEKMFLLTTSSL
jgi:hypothetical protein